MVTFFSQSIRVKVLPFVFICLGVLLLLIGFPEKGHALDVRVAPPMVNIVPGANNTVQLRYTGIESVFPDFSSTSPRGRFEAMDGRLLGTVNKSLAMPIVNSRGMAAEFLTIPVGVISAALERKQSRVFYRRVFSGYATGYETTSEVILTLVPASAGTFSLVRMELAFNQPLETAGTRPSSGGRITVPRFTKGLRAAATLTYNGGGVLRGQWKVDGQILSMVTRQINPGPRETIIASPLTPAFPTYGTGLHKVEFEILDPVPGFDVPMIYYYVTESYTGAPLGSLTLTNPGEQEHVPLSAKALPRFEWQPAGEATHYRFQLYRLDNTLTFDPRAPQAFAYQKPLLSAMTKQTTYDLTEFDVRDIDADVPCCWQVQAFDVDKMVAASVYRRIFFSGPAARTE
jgi:hypothetical protein